MVLECHHAHCVMGDEAGSRTCGSLQQVLSWRKQGSPHSVLNYLLGVCYRLQQKLFEIAGWWHDRVRVKNRNEVTISWLLGWGQRLTENGGYRWIHLFLIEIETVLGKEPGDKAFTSLTQFKCVGNHREEYFGISGKGSRKNFNY